MCRSQPHSIPNPPSLNPLCLYRRRTRGENPLNGTATPVPSLQPVSQQRSSQKAFPPQCCITFSQLSAGTVSPLSAGTRREDLAKNKPQNFCVRGSRIHLLALGQRCGGTSCAVPVSPLTGPVIALGRGCCGPKFSKRKEQRGHTPAGFMNWKTAVLWWSEPPGTEEPVTELSGSCCPVRDGEPGGAQVVPLFSNPLQSHGHQDKKLQKASP